jgi:hypothetical protein
MTERLARFDTRRGSRRTERGDPMLVQRIHDPSGKRRLRPDDHELGRDRLGDEHDAVGIERVDVLERTDARLRADRVTPGCDDDLVHARLDAELPGEGVLPSPAADHEHACGHHQSRGTHAGTT